jgi:hypothetical protein
MDGALSIQSARIDAFVPFWNSNVPASVGCDGMNPEARGAVIHTPLWGRSI